MRVIITAAAALAVSACNDKQTTNDTAAVNESAEVQAIGGNDTTAIDAATNDAANMAADVDLTNLPDNVSDTNESGNNTSANRATANSD